MRCGICGLLIPKSKRRYKQKLCKCVERLMQPIVNKHAKDKAAKTPN